MNSAILRKYPPPLTLLSGGLLVKKIFFILYKIINYIYICSASVAYFPIITQLSRVGDGGMCAKSKNIITNMLRQFRGINYNIYAHKKIKSRRNSNAKKKRGENASAQRA